MGCKESAGSLANPSYKCLLVGQRAATGVVGNLSECFHLC
jgi:hypothetical protein